MNHIVFKFVANTIFKMFPVNCYFCMNMYSIPHTSAVLWRANYVTSNPTLKRPYLCDVRPD